MHIKDLPQLDAYIKEIPELYEKLSIQDLPAIKNFTEMVIKEMPTHREQTMTVTEMPDIKISDVKISDMKVTEIPDILGKPVPKTLYQNDTPAKLKTLHKASGIKVK